MIANSDVKDRILLEAARLFARNGIKSVSMDDIAQHLGVSKKTIYKWFQNKDEIVHSALQNQLSQVENDCECAMVEAENAVDELFQVMTVNKKVLSEIHPSIFYDLQKYHPASWQLWLAHRNSFILSKIVSNLGRGIREGLYRQDLDMELMARLRLALIDLAFSPDLFPPEQFHPERVQSAFFEHFLLGIATLKGHKLINKYKHVTEEE
ncbi:TetR/AcrR family transcriptional regulator [soil metagenome]